MLLINKTERSVTVLKKRIPIGIENYKEMIEYNYYYVDKTLRKKKPNCIIKLWIEKRTTKSMQ